MTHVATQKKWSALADIRRFGHGVSHVCFNKNESTTPQMVSDFSQTQKLNQREKVDRDGAEEKVKYSVRRPENLIELK